LSDLPLFEGNPFTTARCVPAKCGGEDAVLSVLDILATKEVVNIDCLDVVKASVVVAIDLNG
jgi:hypothetical protein